MNYKIFRHPEVEPDLFDLVDLIAEYASKTIKERKLNEIDTALKNLSDTPHVGSLRHEIYPGLRAISVAGKGVISFVVDDEEEVVLVLAFTYAEWTSWGRFRSGRDNFNDLSFVIPVSADESGIQSRELTILDSGSMLHASQNDVEGLCPP